MYSEINDYKGKESRSVPLAVIPTLYRKGQRQTNLYEFEPVVMNEAARLLSAGPGLDPRRYGFGSDMPDAPILPAIGKMYSEKVPVDRADLPTFGKQKTLEDII